MKAQASCTLPRVMPSLTLLAAALDLVVNPSLAQHDTDIPATLSALLEYIFFPLSFLIKHPQISMPNLEATLRVASIVFETASSISKPVWSDFIVILPTILDTSAKAATNIVLNEEIKLLCVKSLKSLLEKPAIELSKFPRPILAQIITELLQMSANERLLDLQVQCLATLRLIIHAVESVELLQQFLPGIVSGLVRVAVRDKKDHHKVIQAALYGISELLCRALSDKLFDTTKATTDMQALVSSIQTSARTPSLPPLIARSLQPLGQAIDTVSTTLQTHPSPFVRHALVAFSFDLIRDCGSILSTSLPRLVETLISYHDDADPFVSEECHNRIKRVAVTHVIKSSFQTHLQRLPRMIERGSEEDKLAALNIGSGYLVLLGKDAGMSLSLALEKLTPGLIHALTLETSDVGLVEDRVSGGLLYTLGDTSIGIDDGTPATRTARNWCNIVTFPRRRFVYFRDERVEFNVSNFLHKMVVYGNVHLLFDHFTSLFRGTVLSGDVQAECLYILNEFCLGLHTSNAASPNQYTDVLKTLVSDLLDSRILEPSPQSQPQPLTITHQNQLIVKASLALETISSVARVLQQDFPLQTTLYPLLASLSSASRPVSTSASAALSVISAATASPSPAHLVVHNVDYIADAVRKRMHYLHLNPTAPHVLRAAVVVGGRRIIPFLDDSLDELFDALDAHGVAGQHVHVHALVAVLLTILLTMHPAPQPCPPHPPSIPAVSEPMRTFHRLHHTRQPSADPSPGPPPDTQRGARLAQRALQHARHYASADAPPLVLAALQSAAAALPLLSHDADAELRDTAVHALWPTVLARLADPCVPVCIAASRLVAVMARTSKSFVARRVVESVWPCVERVLASLPVCPRPQQRSVALAFLDMVSVVARNVAMPRTRDAAAVVHAVYPLMVARVYGKDISEAAVEALVALGLGLGSESDTAKNMDTIWCVSMVAKGCAKIDGASRAFKNVEWPKWYVDKIRKKGSVQDFQGPVSAVLARLDIHRNSGW
ncbi:hypothetical protein SeLEV6574_g06468 [Synchytrium endobioticum]|uniref:Uncharacterized protein n=1 Tax=Synchytrium endobioticum TaxID=286115 RepID=A0A507CNK1_9FUNG|nr:hypothetical protein SeLEV6574_g06468 [Synchytrium endobioticum]